MAMTSNIYYFMSSLPMLRLDERIPFSAADFLDRCRELLGGEVAACLENIALVPDNAEPTDDTVAQWYGFETCLRNAVADMRRARFKLPLKGNERPNAALLPSLKKRIEEIMALNSPVAKEEALDKLRFEFLDGLEAGHYFDKAALDVYMLKLLILDRRSTRRLPEGRAAFDELLSRGFAQANEKRTGDEN